jgi:tail protein P2 I
VSPRGTDDTDYFPQEYPQDNFRVLRAEPIPGVGNAIADPAASGLERAMFDVDGERLMRIPAELIKVQWNPWQISERNLPYLAWAMGMNLYTRISS